MPRKPDGKGGGYFDSDIRGKCVLSARLLADLPPPLPFPQDTIYIHRYMYSMYDRPLASKPKPFIFYLVLVVGSCGANFSKVPCSCEMKLPVLRIWGIPRTCMCVCMYFGRKLQFLPSMPINLT